MEGDYVSASGNGSFYVTLRNGADAFRNDTDSNALMLDLRELMLDGKDASGSVRLNDERKHHTRIATYLGISANGGNCSLSDDLLSFFFRRDHTERSSRRREDIPS